MYNILIIKIFNKDIKMNDLEVKNYNDIYVCRYKGSKKICDRRIADNSFIYISSGILKFNFEGKEYLFKSGECVFVKRDCNIKLTKLPDEKGRSFNGIFFILNQDILKKEYQNYKDNFINITKKIDSIIKIEKNEMLDIFFKTFFDYFDNDIKPNNEIISIKKLEGLYTLLQIKPELASFLFDFNISKKIDLYNFMEKNYKEDLTLEEFAHYSYRSLSTFKREFKKIFNENPHKWILNRRLDEAEKLIKNGEKASNIYLNLGFGSLQHFSTAFKNKFGLGIREIC